MLLCRIFVLHFCKDGRICTHNWPFAKNSPHSVKQDTAGYFGYVTKSQVSNFVILCLVYLLDKTADTFTFTVTFTFTFNNFADTFIQSDVQMRRIIEAIRPLREQQYTVLWFGRPPVIQTQRSIAVMWQKMMKVFFSDVVRLSMLVHVSGRDCGRDGWGPSWYW